MCNSGRKQEGFFRGGGARGDFGSRGPLLHGCVSGRRTKSEQERFVNIIVTAGFIFWHFICLLAAFPAAPWGGWEGRYVSEVSPSLSPDGLPYRSSLILSGGSLEPGFQSPDLSVVMNLCLRLELGSLWQGGKAGLTVWGYG